MPFRRIAAVLSVAGAILLGTALQANAAFAASAAVSTSITTVVVAPPGQVTLTLTQCQGTSMQVQLTWTASGTPGVNGYLSSFSFNGQPYQVQSAWWSTGTVVNVTKPNAAMTMTAVASVMTQTSYGWTASSAQTAPVSC